MALFSEVEAAHFFSGALVNPGPKSSFRDWTRTLRSPVLAEGAVNFNMLRDHAHCEVERAMLLGASNFRRALNLLSPIASPWAFVTLYYAAFYSASALLGALGAWKLADDRVLEADVTRPGAQRFSVRRRRSSYKGSHERFWEYYFANSSLLIPTANGRERFALSPVSSDVTWLISRRNSVNYDTYRAIELACSVKNVFDATKVPASMPGELSTLYRFVDSLVSISMRVVSSVGINSDALLGLSSVGSLEDRIVDLVVSDTPPDVLPPAGYALPS